MPYPNPELFTLLGDARLENTLRDLYAQAQRQNRAMLLHFLPKLPALLGKGLDWQGENPAFYDDKYVPIVPQQGAFLYMQALALRAMNIVEFGTSYGLSTLYLAAAARQNGGRVITTECLPHKAEAAQRNFASAGLADWIELRLGDARQTLEDLPTPLDMALLDGWPDMVFPIFRLIEPHLRPGAIIAVDDVQGFRPAMQDYLDYVRQPANGYKSTTLQLVKHMELTVKL